MQNKWPKVMLMSAATSAATSATEPPRQALVICNMR